MKPTLVIKDLALGKALDRKAMSAVRGGSIPRTKTPTKPDQREFLVVIMKEVVITD
jgi:hypothetical protein